MNQGQGVTRDLTDELLEEFEVSIPLFDLGDQIQGDVDGMGLGLALVGEVPARGGAARTAKGTKRALQERANLSDLTQDGIAADPMAVGRTSFRFHIGSIYTS